MISNTVSSDLCLITWTVGVGENKKAVGMPGLGMEGIWQGYGRKGVR